MKKCIVFAKNRVAVAQFSCFLDVMRERMCYYIIKWKEIEGFWGVFGRRISEILRECKEGAISSLDRNARKCDGKNHRKKHKKTK